MNSTSAPFKNEHIIILYFSAVVLYCLILACKKIHYRIHHKKRLYIFPQLEIRRISGVSMMTAMNIAIIITISLLSNQIMGIFFRVYPGARFLIENILIKLGGILFGPLVGIFIGFTTDLLTVIFTSSVLNYGYFFSAMMNGFLGGLIHLIIRIKEKGNIRKTIYSLSLAFSSLILMGIVLYANSMGKPYNTRILSLNLSFQWYTLFLLIFSVVFIGAVLLLMSAFATSNINNEKHNYKKWVQVMNGRYSFFLIAMCNTSIYLLVDMMALPMFDVSLSSLPYEQFLVCRILVSIPSIILFSYLIHYIYRLHTNINSSKSGGDDSMVITIEPLQPESEKKLLTRLSL